MPNTFAATQPETITPFAIRRAEGEGEWLGLAAEHARQMRVGARDRKSRFPGDPGFAESGWVASNMFRRASAL
jgi:hypothetical protein